MANDGASNEVRDQELSIEKPQAVHHDADSKENDDLEDPEWRLDLKIIITFIVRILVLRLLFTIDLY